MGIVENWNKIEREHDRWGKTIKNNAIVSFVCIVIGMVLGISIILLTGSIIGLPVTVVFCAGGLLYQNVIGGRKIQAHIDRVDELKRKW